MKSFVKLHPIVLPTMICICGWTIFPSESRAVEILPLLQKTQLWTTPSEGFDQAFPDLGFEWVSAQRDTARSSESGLVFAEMPVAELITRFPNGELQEINMVIYNRGDTGEISREKFDALLAQATELSSKLANTKPKEKERDPTGIVRSEGLVWNTPVGDLLLEWSVTREVRSRNIPFRPEFIRLIIRPPGAIPAESGPSDGTRRRAVNLEGPLDERVTRSDDGEIKIDSIPMVDQGQKGYCVVATVERVLRYYGATVDQHELAQLGNTESAGGTSVREMMESMKKLTGRLGVKVRNHFEWDVYDFIRFVSDYNRATKRGREAPEVRIDEQYVDISGAYAQMKGDLLIQVRANDRSAASRFERDLEKLLNEGIPVLWSVQLGLLPEGNLPQSIGGHMRLIIGMNPKTREIIYSDSWGMGHEEKRMPIDQAWAITTGLNSLQPL